METIEPAALPGWLAALDRNLELWISCLPHTVFCVDANGQPLGFAMWLPDGDAATLVSIQVLGSHRRQGLGRLLLEAFEQRAGSAAPAPSSSACIEATQPACSTRPRVTTPRAGTVTTCSLARPWARRRRLSMCGGGPLCPSAVRAHLICVLRRPDDPEPLENDLIRFRPLTALGC